MIQTYLIFSMNSPAFPAYGILSIILGFAMIAMTIASVIGYRHYKLEAEISSMIWKIDYNDINHGTIFNQVEKQFEFI